MLEDVAILSMYHFFLIFCRIGSAMMVSPGFGEIYVNGKVRISMALVICLMLTPLLSPSFPPVPVGILQLFIAIVPEIMIGLFFGLIIRMVQSILHIAGMVIAFQSSLASALLFDANQGSQGSVIGNFMTLVGVTLLFATNLHHLILAGIIDSYNLFTVSKYPITSDLAEMISRTLSSGFLVAVKISSPLLVIGLCVYIGSGILGRLMPQMQVFMVMIPAQIYVAFTFVLITFSAGMMWYLDYFKEVIGMFVAE